MSPPIDRALPGPVVDLIRDGVSPAALKAGADKAVWDALVSSAASAAARGHSEWEWLEQVMDPRHRLGQQARLKRSGRQVRTDAQVRDLTGDAWERATVWLSERPAAWTAEQVAAEAQDRALAALAVAGDLENDLADSDRAVLAFAATEAQRRGLTKVTLPRLSVVKGTGVGERAVVNALERLVKRDLLERVTRGRSGGDATKRKAATYRLRSREALAAYLYPVNRVYGTPAQVYGTPPTEAPGTPRQVYGTPHTAEQPDATAPLLEDPVITLHRAPDGSLTLEAPEGSLDRVLAVLAAEGLVVQPPAAETAPAEAQPRFRIVSGSTG